MTGGRVFGALVPVIFCAVLLAGVIWYLRNRDKE